jgi:two-component system sensor histidine kinase DesK
MKTPQYISGRDSTDGDGGVLRRDSSVDGLIRLASAGALVSGVALPLVALGLLVANLGSEYVPLVAAATAVFLPLHVRHLRHALRGTRPHGGGWTLGVMAVVIVGPTPLVGPFWLQMWHVLAASAFLVLRPRWAISAYLGLAACAGIWGYALAERIPTTAARGSDAGWAAWFALMVVSRGLVPIVLVWLVVALRRLEAARLALANEAVEMERQRMDDEFQLAVGGELEVLVAVGERASKLAEAGLAPVEGELRSLVDRSRRTLAEARRILSRDTPPLRTELESAVALLHSAGIDATLELPDGDLPAALDDTLRSSLRRLTTELLHDDLPGPVILSLVNDGGRLHLERRSQAASTTPPRGPVA